MKKYLVLHIIDSFATGGLEKQVFNMMLYGNSDAYVICLSKAGYFGDKLIANGERVIYLKSNTVLGRLSEIYTIFKQDPTVIIHAHNQKAYFYASVIKRFFSTTHVLMSKHGENFTSGKLSDLISKNFLKNDHIIAVSNKIKKMCHKEFGGDINRISVVANGSPFREYHQKKNSLLINIGTVGRLAKVKNYALLIRVFSSLTKTYKNIKLTIVGDGPERQSLENLVVELGVKDKVFFAGLQQEVSTFLEEMDVFVISSDSEGLPLVLLEAASHSIPVISTKVGAIPDVLQHNESVLFSPPKDEIKLLENLKVCVDDPDFRNMLAKNAHKQLQSIFSIESSLKAHTKIYEIVQDK